MTLFLYTVGPCVRSGVPSRNITNRDGHRCHDGSDGLHDAE